MEAGNWEELDFLLKSAGVPVDKAMGLGKDSSDESEGLCCKKRRLLARNLLFTF